MVEEFEGGLLILIQTSILMKVLFQDIIFKCVEFNLSFFGQGDTPSVCTCIRSPAVGTPVS